MDGLALLIFPIYGRGPFTIDLGSFKIEAKGQLGARLNGTLFLRQLDFNITLANMTINFEGLLGGGELGDVLNQIVNEMGLTIYNHVMKILNDTLVFVVTEIINFSLKVVK